MRITTPKARRQVRSGGKQLQATSKVVPLGIPARLRHKPGNSFDISAKATLKERVKPVRVMRRPDKSGMQGSGVRQVPRSATHRRRSSVAEINSKPNKRMSVRAFSLDYTSLPAVAKFSHRTREGMIPDNPNKVNQDAYFECVNLGPRSDIYLFGVCDGHGAYGHYVSGFVRQRLPQLFASDLSQPINKALRSSILKCNDELKKLNIDTNFSGTTLITVVIQGKKLWCANVGDSRAVLGRQLAGERQWMAIALSRDHKPDLPEEAKRIASCGGRVQSYSDEDGQPVGPARVWLRNEDIPGLAMSRSLGDGIASSVGVVPTPEILEFELTTEDKFVFLASDGVFEFLSNEDIVKIVIPHWKIGDIDTALDIIEAESVNYWKQEEEVIDDITSLCVFLDIIN